MSGRRLAPLFMLAAALAVLCAAGVAAASTAPADAAINDPCFKCHGTAEAKAQTIDAGGQQRSIYVDRAKYEASSHGRLACTSCHIGFKPGPHTPEQTEGWLETAKLAACENCHADTFEMYRGSFHGDLVFGECERAGAGVRRLPHAAQHRAARHPGVPAQPSTRCARAATRTPPRRT